MDKKAILIKLILFSLLVIQPIYGMNPVAKSFLLPGWGEYDLKRPVRGRTFLMSETVLWTSLISTLVIKNNYRDRSRAFAAEFAGVSPNEKDRQFWIDVGNYASRNDHNDEHLRFREYESLYPNNSEWNWEWVSENQRKRYRHDRVASDQWLLAAKFVAGGIVMNHIVSAIDALYIKRTSTIEKVSLIPIIDSQNSAPAIALEIQF